LINGGALAKETSSYKAFVADVPDAKPLLDFSNWRFE